jgi:hypothetical protein
LLSAWVRAKFERTITLKLCTDLNVSVIEI